MAGISKIDVDAPTHALGYPVRWHHLAMVVWYPEAGPAEEVHLHANTFKYRLGRAISRRGVAR